MESGVVRDLPKALAARLRRKGVTDPALNRLAQQLRGSRRECKPDGRLGRPGEPLLILSGVASQERRLADGRRQIGRFVFPGDVVGIEITSAEGRWPSMALSDVVACELRPFLELHSRTPHPVATIFLNDAAQAHADGLQRQVRRLGMLTALERTADLLLELHERHVAAGLGQAERFTNMALQRDLAAALALSGVHQNRMLRHLSDIGAVSYRGRQFSILQPDLLRQIAQPEDTEARAAERQAERHHDGLSVSGHPLTD